MVDVRAMLWSSKRATILVESSLGRLLLSVARAHAVHLHWDCAGALGLPREAHVTGTDSPTRMDDRVDPPPAFGWPHWTGEPLPAHASVHVWASDLDLPARAPDRAGWMLEADERARGAALTRPEQRWRFAASREMLRTLIAWALGVEAAALRFERGPHGKPRLVDASGRDRIRFSLSRSGRAGLVALSRTMELGADVERVRELSDLGEIADLALSSSERRQLQELDPARATAALFRQWTRKEALLKGLGTGLSVDPRSVTISLPAACDMLAGTPAASQGTLAHWRIQDLAPAPGWAGALAVRGPACEVRRWSWPPPAGDVAGPGAPC